MPFGIIAAAGSIIGGLASSGAASDAANAQEKASKAATDAQLQMFKTVNDQQAPYRQAGNTALSALLYSMGLGPNGSAAAASASPQAMTYDQWAAAHPGTSNTGIQDYFGAATPLSAAVNNGQGPWRPQTIGGPTQDGYNAYLNAFNSQNAGASNGVGLPGVGYGDLSHQFNASDLGTNLSPSYDFMLGQGLGALQNSQAAQGGLVGGNALRGINDYAQNYASTGYQQAFNNYTGNQTNIFNRLSNIAGLGQTANQTTAGAASAISPGVASSIQNAGQAQASGIVGSTNALTAGANNAMGWYQLSKLGGSPSGTDFYSGDVPGYMGA